jgi:hypothetical protein
MLVWYYFWSSSVAIVEAVSGGRFSNVTIDVNSVSLTDRYKGNGTRCPAIPDESGKALASWCSSDFDVCTQLCGLPSTNNCDPVSNGVLSEEMLCCLLTD